MPIATIGVRTNRNTSFGDAAFEPLESRRLLASYAIADYEPLNVGDQWSYSGSLNGAQATAVATLSAGGDIGGFATGKLSTVFSPTAGGGSTTFSRYYAHTWTGLRLLREDLSEPTLSSTTLFGVGARIASITIEDGISVHILKSFTGESSDGKVWSGRFVGDMNVGGLENIHVAAGSFEALRISVNGTFNQTGSTGWTATGTVAETVWLVRGVGAVRADYASTVVYSDSSQHAFRYNMGLTSSTRLRGTEATVVRGKGVDISYGDSSPTTLDGTNYGGIDVNGQTKTRAFVVQNVSNHPITFAAGNRGLVTISGLNAGDFDVVGQPAQTIQPGEITRFFVRFDPAAIGFRFATVSFKTTEPNAQPFLFSIRGTGLYVGALQVRGPQNQIIPNGAGASPVYGTSFGSMETDGNGRIQRIFTITNTGPGMLGLSGDSNDRVMISGGEASDFTVTHEPVQWLFPGQTTFFKVSFNPSSVGAQSVLVTILSNDWRASPFTFSISGTGV